MGNLYTVIQNLLLAGERPYPWLQKVLPMLKRGASRAELLEVLPLHPAAKRALAKAHSQETPAPNLAA
jgi:hypothetical protein